MYQKEIKGLKYDNKRMSMDTRDNKDRYEQAIKGLRDRQDSERKDFQQQFGALKQASVAYKQQFSDSQIKYSQTLKLLNTARITTEELEDQLDYAKQESIKQAKGTKLVICLQNFVRKMLVEKLEEQARQLAALSGKNSDEVNNLRRAANEIEEDQIQADSEAAEDKEKAEAVGQAATEIEESKEESKDDSDNEGLERRGTIIKVAGNTDKADEEHNKLQAQEEEEKKEQEELQEQQQSAKDNEN